MSNEHAPVINYLALCFSHHGHCWHGIPQKRRKKEETLLNFIVPQMFCSDKRHERSSRYQKVGLLKHTLPHCVLYKILHSSCQNYTPCIFGATATPAHRTFWRHSNARTPRTFGATATPVHPDVSYQPDWVKFWWALRSTCTRVFLVPRTGS